MNAIDTPQVFFRSLATRGAPPRSRSPIPWWSAACRAAGFDLVIVETPGIGQGDAAVIDIADVSLYVMTPEYGAASQLEKIDMLDLADVVAINKFDRRGADDALRQVRRQWARDHPAPARHRGPSRCSAPSPPGSTTTGVTALFQRLKRPPGRAGPAGRRAGVLPPVAGRRVDRPPRRSSRPSAAGTWPRSPSTVRGYHADTERGLAAEARRAEQVGPPSWSPSVGRRDRRRAGPAAPTWPSWPRTTDRDPEPADRLLEEWARAPAALRRSTTGGWPDGRRRSGPARGGPPSPGTRVPRVALPRVTDRRRAAALAPVRAPPRPLPLHRRRLPLQTRQARTRPGCSPARATPFRTNRRFHLLAEGQPATRLSTAFDSVTLYGLRPRRAPRHLRQDRHLRACPSPPSTT